MITINRIKDLIAKGETDYKTHIEFKSAENDIPKSVYETVCAFLNTKGGHIILGVKDNGQICGVNPDKVGQLKQDFSNNVNNSQKIDPPFPLSIQDLDIDGKIILYVYVPEGSVVYRCNNKIFLRNTEGDYNITSNQQAVANLYLQKQTSYSENKIYPYLKLEHLRKDLIDRTRKLANIQNPSNTWQEMDDMAMLRHASLYQTDFSQGQEGFTLAAVLLLGTDEVIRSVVPDFRIDVIKRVDNVDRYDDRLDIRTNLIESYDKIMQFIEKHLPDNFYLEGSQRISLRDNIFREVVANILVHKEYLKAEPTKLVIEKNRVYTENSNKPYINGLLSLENLQSHPKNPNIARFFRQIGRVEELGSGVAKLTNYGKEYSGHTPTFKDENLFIFELKIDFFAKADSGSEPVSAQVNSPETKDSSNKNLSKAQVSEPVSEPVDIESLLLFCQDPKSLIEITQNFEYGSKKYFKKNILDPLIEKGLVRPTEEKANSPKQKYISVKR